MAQIIQFPGVFKSRLPNDEAIPERSRTGLVRICRGVRNVPPGTIAAMGSPSRHRRLEAVFTDDFCFPLPSPDPAACHGTPP